MGFKIVNGKLVPDGDAAGAKPDAAAAAAKMNAAAAAKPAAAPRVFVPKGANAVGVAPRGAPRPVELGGTTEASVGISHYMNSAPGWDCIVKHRYADFIVQEVDPAGVVAGLASIEPPDQPATPKTEAPAELEDIGVEPGLAWLSSQGLCSEADIDRLRKLLTTFVPSGANAVGRPADETTGDARQQGMDFVVLAASDDKVGRTKVHEAVRKHFEGFDTDTVDDLAGGPPLPPACRPLRPALVPLSDPLVVSSNQFGHLLTTC